MKFLQIDEEGFPSLNGLRVNREYGSELLKNISRLDENGKIFCIRKPDEKIYIEAFDQPYVAQSIERMDGKFQIRIPFDIAFEFSLDSLCLDEWDRFHGFTAAGIPFVFSRKAQAAFFDLLDEFDDTSITVNSMKFEVPNLFSKPQAIEKSKFWNEMYDAQNTPWDRGPHPSLKYILPQLKIPKSRVLVLGCGYGHDAAFLAQNGHFVTGIDFSDEAIDHARRKYGSIPNLKFEKHDLFNLPNSYLNSFDIMFEHTCYCAIDPGMRSEIVKIWRNCLADQGHLLGIFFVHNSYSGIPYGGTEWELRERLKSRFLFLFWTRWHGETTRAPTQELIIYAKRR